METEMPTADVLDPAVGAARDVARAALRDAAEPDAIGDHVGVAAEGAGAATHLFEALLAGYRGWRWAVTVSRAPDSEHITVDEVVLLPGPDALVAPPWVPWSERIQAGDLGPGDVLQADPDDERLVPGMCGSDDLEDELRPRLWELGLGRERVLSLEGRDEAARRWRHGEGGPRNEMTRMAPGRCSTCGFLAQLAGGLGQEFGVCANGDTPFDGRVVTLDHGCGGHSEAPRPRPDESPTVVLDDEDLEIIDAQVEPEPGEAPADAEDSSPPPGGECSDAPVPEGAATPAEAEPGEAPADAEASGPAAAGESSDAPVREGAATPAEAEPGAATDPKVR